MLVTRLSRVLMPVLLLTQVGVANADLRLLKPDPAIPATAVGNVGYSADALGQDGTGGTVQAEVPAGSTVLQAYLYGAYVFNADPVPPDTEIDFDGTLVTLVEVPGSQPGLGDFATARADVTGQVAAKVGGGGGITDFAVNTDPASLSGVSLVVIYSNAALPMTTIAVLDGGALQAGDATTFMFGSPLDKTVPGFAATLSLGSGHSFQGFGSPHECGSESGQSSLVDVNGTRLTSCAGNFDDGIGDNGGLITTGGVGDGTNNPAFPLQQPADGSTPRGEDDELYNIEPFLSQGDTQLQIVTSNPSGDDNLFLAIVVVTAEADVTTEICNDGIDNDGDGLIDSADPDCPPPPPSGVTCNGLPATIVGNNNNNTIVGTPGSDVIHGRGGNDVIKGLGGNDHICGGSGADQLFGNQGKDQLFGEAGNDRLKGGTDNDRLYGQAGNDAMDGEVGNDDNCNGGTGTDTATSCEQPLNVP